MVSVVYNKGMHETWPRFTLGNRDENGWFHIFKLDDSGAVCDYYDFVGWTLTPPVIPDPRLERAKAFQDTPGEPLFDIERFRHLEALRAYSDDILRSIRFRETHGYSQEPKKEGPKENGASDKA